MRETLFTLLWGTGVLAIPALAADPVSPEQLLQHGQAAYQRGSFPQAVLDWTEAARLYEQQGQLREQAQTLIQLSQSLQQVGRYREAAAALQLALGIEEEQGGDSARRALILGRLGNLGTVLGKDHEAETLLNEALGIARSVNDPQLIASLLNDFGTVLAGAGRSTEAARAYSESAELAGNVGHTLMRVTATINAARVDAQQGAYMEGKTLLDPVPAWLAALEESHDKAFAWLTYGLTYEMLRGAGSKGVLSQFEARDRSIEAGSRKIVVRPSEPSAPEELA